MTVLMADRQKPSTKAATSVKKTLSSPNVRAMVDPENGDTSPIDKKRNKLGYHRTAVACGHCRRRKIRCIPSPDASATRCQNCIRLKKDCQFFPVDQNATAQPKRNRSESKGETLVTESETSVSSSSPGIHTGITPLEFDHFGGAVETTSIGQGPDQDYQHPYDNRQWYSPEQPQHPYWLQQEHNHPNSFAPSPYPMTPTTNGHPVTSQDHAYSYPAIALGHPTYPYPNHRPRDGPLNSSAGPPAPFGEFRANTMPDRLGMPDEASRAHDMHAAGISVPPQQILGGGPPQPIVGSPSQYATSTAHQVWLPAHSDPQHHAPNYMPPSTPQSWYNQSAGLNGLREDDGMYSHARDHGLQNGNHFRPKPG